MFRPDVLCVGAVLAQGGCASNGMMYPESQVRFKDIADGSSKTLLIGELSWDSGVMRTWVVGSQHSPGNGVNWYRRTGYGARNVTEPINTFANFKSDATSPPVPDNDICFGSLHAGGAHFAFADGSGRMFSENIEINVYKALASRNVGETVSDD